MVLRAHHARSAAPQSLLTPHQSLRVRTFTTSRRLYEQRQQHRKEGFGSRLRKALADTPIKWQPIPVALGVAFLGGFQWYRVHEREKARDLEERGQYVGSAGDPGDGGKRPKKRERIRPSGPWQVQIMSTLPLKALSRLWGRFNELTIPYYLRVPGFKLYGWIFGVNFDEVSEPDLHVYPNLASFFYRTLKPGVRPLDPNPNSLLSPADGRVIQFGTIDNGEVEQVKGVTYSLDALLGSQAPSRSPSVSGASTPSGTQTPTSNIASSSSSPQPSSDRSRRGDEEIIQTDEEFAQVNGISYTLPSLFSGGSSSSEHPHSAVVDQSTSSHPSSESEVRAEMALSAKDQPWWSSAPSDAAKQTQLYYMVIYLAPGDYHRFHSPCSWVVESRRHFAGELYSVSPYLQRTLPGLFTLNERVVLLGRWRWGFFSYTPVGATNVGSIKINFDAELRTNSLTTDTAADRAAEEAKDRGEPYSGYAEATYEHASSVLGGHALKRGEEMGGFQLGSTIVMVFEAPKGRRPSFDEGGLQVERKGGWRWGVEKGQRVKVGEAVGWVEEE